MQNNNSIKHNFIMNAILTMSSMLFPIVTFPYVSRVLTPVGTGKVSFSFSLITYFLMFAQLGIPTYGIRVCASVRDDKEKLTRTAHELLMINLIMSGISYILLFLALIFVPRLYGDRLLYSLMSVTIILDTLGMEWLYKALEQYTYIAARSVLFKFIALILMFLMIHTESDYVIYGVIFIFAASASNVVNFINAHKHISFRNVKHYDIKRHLKPVGIFFALACASTIYTNLDALMLGFMKADIDVGYYNAAVKIKNVLVSIVTSLGAVILPRASYYVENGEMEAFRRIYRKALNFVMIIAVPVSVYFTMYAEEGILFLSGDAYHNSILPMQIILPTVIMIGLTNILGIQILVPLGKEKIVLYSEIVGAVIDVILNILLIPGYGASGAAVGTLAAEIAVFIVQFIALRKEVIDAFIKISYGRIIIAVIAGCLTAMFVKSLEYGNFITLSISSILFFGAYAIVLIVMKESMMTEIYRSVVDKAGKISERIISLIDSRVSESMRKGSERFFLVVMTCYLLFVSFMITEIKIPFPDNMYTLMMLPMFLAVVLQWFTHIKDIKRVIIGGAVLGLFLIVYVTNIREYSGYGHMVLYALMTAGCIGIEFRKLLRTWIYSIGSVISIAFLAASIGIAENLVYYVGGYRLKLRGALGVWYPTDCAAWILFFLLILWIAYKKLPNVIMLVLVAGGAVFAKLYCDSNNTTICMLLFFAAILYLMFEEKVIDGREKLIWIKKTVTGLAYAVFPVAAVTMIAVVVMYGKGIGIAYKMDRYLHGRANYGWNALKEYKITPFGTNFEMFGFGSAVITDKKAYNFLDSSYVNILIRYGFVVFIVVGVIWFYLMRKASKADNRRMLFVMAIIAIHSFEEHHMLDVMFNPLIPMVLADFSMLGKSRSEETSLDIRKYAGYAAGFVAAAGLLIAVPRIFSIIRTVIDIENALKGEDAVFYGLALIIVMLVSVVLVVGGIAVIVQSSVFKKRDHVKGIACCVAGVVITAVMCIICNVTISAKSEVYAERIKDDKAAVDIMIAAKEHPLYALDYPEVYKQEFGTFSDTFYSEEDIARCHRATVLLDSTKESNCFENRGYLYTQISDHTGVYTNDEAVLTALEDAGYHITGYYSAEREVPLDETLKSGEKFAAFSGRYVATAELELVSSKGDPEGKIGELRVDAYDDANAVGAEPVALSDFNNGIATVDVVFNIGTSTPNTVISVVSEDGYDINLKSLKYRLRPNLDTHKHYNDIYQVIRSEYFDADGNRITAGSGEAAVEYEYDDRRNNNVIRYYGIDYKPLQIPSGYAEIHRTYNKMRYVVAESYYGVDGKPVALGSGQASEARKVDDRGNITESKYFDVDGNPCMLTGGYAEVHREYDEKSKLIREEYYDTEGKPVMLSGGYASLSRINDEEGNILSESYYGTDGELCLNTYGYAKVEREFDDNNNAVVQRFYGADGNPCICTSGYAEIHREFDELKRVTSESYFGTDGKPMVITSGYAQFKREYDSMGRVTKESYFGTDGEPMALTTGQASDTRVYDANSNCIEQRYFGPDGNPVIINSGFAEIHREFNAKNQVIKEIYYGIDGNIMSLTSGYAMLGREYDDAGNVICQIYYDKDGNRVNSTSGYAEFRRRFNEQRQITAESYFDTDGNPVALTTGQASDEREYDAAGNMTAQRFYGTDGKPVIVSYGYAEFRRQFDSKKRITYESYFGDDGNPIALESGQTSAKLEYDSYDNLIRAVYYGTDGEPVIITKGYAELRRTFNDKRQLVGESYYGVDGEPIANDVGVASKVIEVDDVGNAVAEKFYDVSGNMALRSDGIAEIRRVFNGKRQVTAESYYDTEGNPAVISTGQASVTYDLDDRGNAVDAKYYGVNGDLIMRSDGFAEIKRQYNEKNKLVREEYYDIDGNLSDRSDGFAWREFDYDENGNQTAERRYNSNGVIIE